MMLHRLNKMLLIHLRIAIGQSFVGAPKNPFRATLLNLPDTFVMVAKVRRHACHVYRIAEIDFAQPMLTWNRAANCSKLLSPC